ncbi:vesicle transport protein SFT2A, putative [Entamoeba invadens IP1]|uniref:Vesicle transport protein n=1 Tax=Entamoeba invadens IP1 TaxID=370355 RepID=A0A0A1U333_ENTIV|nr:vesicle transport protein SFT2A, putative [Entamoeba invadens IP1]ELP85964.1 vesicle transport protein SFT2A, putative [Entamoeba invadens IP1]|eukprot:XP_004185310.1 vesicle transport protein SFT2A, putative [Entamoeba invadens IP1]
MESIKSGWSSLKNTVRNTVNGPPQQEEDYFSKSWFDTLVGGDDDSCCAKCKIPFTVRITIVGILVLLGVIALFLSFSFIVLPMKFAKLFTAGNVLILAASFFLRSFSAQIKSLMEDKTKLIGLVLYITSIVLVLFAALKLKSFFVTIPCVIFEIIALLWYLFSYIPYGQEMLKKCGSCLLSSCFKGGE